MDGFADTLWIGAAAQLLQALLGAGYGVGAASMLLACGMPPLLVSASTHASSVSTQGVAALTHWRLGNLDFDALRRLAGFGLLGAICGLTLALLVPTAWLSVAVAAYLLLLGGWLVCRGGCRQRLPQGGWRGFVAGLLDAGGGGGWGTLTATPETAADAAASRAQASSHAAAFLVSALVCTVLVVALGGIPVGPVLGLLAGAVLAAPFAAQLSGRLRPALASGVVGAVVATLALVGMWRALVPV